MFFKNIKLRTGIAVCMIALVTVTALLSVTILFRQFTAIVERNAKSEAAQTVEQLANFYNERLCKTIDFTYDMFSNDRFSTSINITSENEEYNLAKSETNIQDLFSRIMIKEQIFDSMLLSTPETYYADNGRRIGVKVNEEELETFKQMNNYPNIYWGTEQSNKLFHKDSKVIPVIVPPPFGDIKSDVFLIINLSVPEFLTTLQQINHSTKSNVYIVNEQGECVTKSEVKSFDGLLDSDKISEAEGTGYFQEVSGSEKLYVNYATININNWRVFLVETESELLKDAKYLKVFVIVLLLIMLAISYFLAVVLAKTITNPVYRLKKSMQKVRGGDLSVRVETSGSVEISELGTTFNEMLDNTEELIKQLEEQKQETKIRERQKRKAELQVLQAQINPHFLYNTLDSIYWKSKSGRNELVSGMIMSLSRMLRTGLSKGSIYIPMAMEADHVRNYLYVQSNVYEGKFTYEISCEPEAEEYNILKLIIQPLAENSVLHGFENISDGGVIKISIYIDKDDIVISVCDNGCGFNAAEIEEKMKSDETSAEKSSRGGFALKNIYKRLSFVYGEDFSISMRSEPYKENVVEIRIKKEACKRV